MSDSAQHLSDELILRWIDNELPARDVHLVQEHLSACPACRDRRSAMESTSSDLEELYRSEAPTPHTSGIESRLHLHARLVKSRQASCWQRGLASALSLPLMATAVLAAVFVALAFQGAQGWKFWLVTPTAEAGVLVPDRSLTPGAVRPVTLAEVCSADDGDLDPGVSPSTEKAVLAEYGIHPGEHAKNYQIDYLVNPQLGGTSDIRNLWPEPDSNSKWNARAKDELERRLHQMVCNRTIDLAVAQQEIATDWIAAYKRYVRDEHS